MEMLPEGAGLKEVEDVGLLPLVKILQTGMVSLTAIGVNEMPDLWVNNAHTAYEKFCRKFWPWHKDDPEATFRSYDDNSTDKKVKFNELDDGSRCVYGSAYVSMLQIQNIKRNYSHLFSDKQFELYLHSIIGHINIISAFELEIAKYAFWEMSPNEMNQLPNNIRIRRKDIKYNFTKVKSTLDKCREFAFDAAMDIHWLSGANLAEDLNLSINIDGRKLKLDNWVGTNDHKLYRISRDIHSVYHDGSNMKRMSVTREYELSSSLYWQTVDSYANGIMRFRNQQGDRSTTDLLQRIDSSVQYIESELMKSFDQSGPKGP
jgi:hypothetical protein